MIFRIALKITLTMLVTLALAGLCLAEEEKAEEVKDVKKMNGKELYINFCKVCHTEDSKAGEVTPMSLIMDQWDEFFDETFPETHKEIPSPQDEKKMVPDMFDKDMIKKLRKFCVDHAADSEEPMTCG
jgi:hypothetical protein